MTWRVGRKKSYESIRARRTTVFEAGIPESFNVLSKRSARWGLNIETDERLRVLSPAFVPASFSGLATCRPGPGQTCRGYDFQCLIRNRGDARLEKSSHETKEVMNIFNRSQEGPSFDRSVFHSPALKIPQAWSLVQIKEARNH